MKFKILEGKVVKIWLKNKFFRQGKLMEVSSDGVLVDDRKDGISFISYTIIESISEVKDGRARE